ncbi:MAG: taurine dioxygenase [Deltaproteobacteria bacterium]|jgi:taurine dioxygenase|nr:taurine dioxygenase [Deltaproteobacteria bacterium]
MALEHHPAHVLVPERDLGYRSFEIRTLTPHIGAELRGIDLAQPLSSEQDKELRRALHDWKVLVFPDQDLSAEQHKTLGAHFGRLHVHPQLRGADMKHPEILPVITNKDSLFTAGDGWHADVTCEEIPLMGSMLYIRETPECGGGDTLYADMCMAYELLSEPMKQFLSGLTAIHDGAGPYSEQHAMGIGRPAPGEDYPRAQHPVIVRHPETGQKLLYVNSGFTTRIVELSAAESRSVLDLLFRHVESNPKLCCRVHWAPKTLTFWDNRSTQHRAIWDYHPHARVGGRVSILAEARPSA